MKKTVISALLASSLLATGLAGCTKAQMGTVLGAGGGAAIGSQIGSGRGQLAAVAIGTLLGAYAGSQVGASLDRADQAYANQTAQNSFEQNPDGAASSWQNPNSGHSGTVTPTYTYQTNTGQYCREYTQTINVGGQSEQAYGRACRMPDGSWQIQN